jgi:hypothetical protein
VPRRAADVRAAVVRGTVLARRDGVRALALVAALFWIMVSDAACVVASLLFAVAGAAFRLSAACLSDAVLRRKVKGRA